MQHLNQCIGQIADPGDRENQRKGHTYDDETQYHLGSGQQACVCNDPENRSPLPEQQNLKPTHTVIPNALNVREGPGSDYNRIGGVTAGKEVIVVDIIGEWSKIVYGNGYGWVQWKYLKLIV